MNQEYSDLLIDLHAPDIALGEIAAADWMHSATTEFTEDSGKWKCKLSFKCKVSGETFKANAIDFERDQACSQALLSAISKRYEAGHYGSMSDDQDTIGNRLDLVHECQNVEQALRLIDKPIENISFIAGGSVH